MNILKALEKMKMKNKTIWVIIMCSFLFLGCIKYISPVDMNPIGTKYIGTINLRGMDLPLPKGEWEVVGRSFYKNHKFVQIILEKDVGNKPDTIISINRDTRNNSYSGYSPSRTLKRTNMLYVVSNNNKNQEAQDGWYINHIRYASPGKKASDANKEAFQHIINNKLAMPGNFLKIKHRFTGSGNSKKFLTYTIYLNPEVHGFSPPTNSEWASSDWNILKINNDPEKVVFIEKIKHEQAKYHNSLRNAFNVR